MAATDDEIVQEVIMLIAQRKGLVTIQVDFQTGEHETHADISRNWIIEAVKAVKPVVQSIRRFGEP